MTKKAADIYLQLCSTSEQLPDVFEFLANENEVGERAQLDVLLVDQFQRWKNNQTIPVDHYLERTPDLSDVLKVELLIEEYGYLDQRGVAPSPEAFAKRFHALSTEAKRELYDALEIEPLSDSHSGGSDPEICSSDNETGSPAELIGRYNVTRLLGKGAFGKVYLARDPDLDRSVAIKVPTKQRIEIGGGTEEFLNEARAVAKLDHPNIVPVYDCGVTEEGRCFVVSKYIRGKELRKELRKGINHAEASFIVGTLARALHVAHSAGIVHRDVKPGNVIIDAKRQPHLLDFGLARSEQDTADRDALVGTPAYMSPEQAGGDGHRVDGRSDIYSLGVVFYELLTGHRPCKSDTVAEMIEQIKHGEVRPPRQSDDTIPIELERICLKALSRKLSDRYNTAKDMADEIERYLFESGAELQASEASSSASFGSRSSGSFSNRPESQRSVAESNAASGFRSPWVIVASLAALTLFSIMLFSNPPWKNSNPDPNPSDIGSTAGGGEPNTVEANLGASKTEDSLTAKPTASPSTNRLAILGFRNVGNDPARAWLSTGLTEMLTDEMKRSAELQVVSTRNVSLLKSDLDLGETETLAESTLNRVKDRIGPRWIVLGSYAPSGAELDQIRLDVSVQTPDSKEIIEDFSLTVDNDQWLSLTELAGAKLRDCLDLSAPDMTQTGVVNLRPPANQDAVEHYFDGLKMLRAFKPLEAKSLLEKAATKDPDSSLVQDGLAQSMSQLGDDQSARKHSAKAVELSKALDKKQLLKVKGRNHLLEGRPADAVATFRELVKFKNHTIDDTLLLAEAMTVAGQGRSALELLEESRSKTQLHASDFVQIELAAAEAAQSVSEYSQQIKFAGNAKQHAKSIGARIEEGRAALLEGEAQRRIGEYKPAIESFDHAFRLLVAHGDQPNAARAIGAWGKALVDSGELDQAESKIAEGLKLSKEIENKRLIARHTGQLGELDVYRGKFDEATSRLSEALSQFESLGDHGGVADMNLTLANVLARQGKPDEAIKMIGDARQAFQASGDRRGEARTWGQQGAVHGRKGEVPEAQRHFERALELFREVGDRQGEATGLGDLANTYMSQGNLEQAGELYSKALEIHRKLASKRGPALVLYNLSVLYMKTGRLRESRNLMQESFEAFEQQGNHMNACFVQRKLGDVQMSCGDLKEAKKTLTTALEKSKKVGSSAVEAQALASLGLVAEHENQIDDAIKLQKESQAIRLEIKQEFNAKANDYVLARLANKQNRTDDALKLLTGVLSELSIGKPDWEPMLLAMKSQYESQLEDSEAAAESVDQAKASMKKADRQDVNISLTSKLELARAYSKLNRVEEAIAGFEEVIKLAKKQGLVLSHLTAQIELAAFQKLTGKEIDKEELASLLGIANKTGFVRLADQVKSLLDE